MTKQSETQRPKARHSEVELESVKQIVGKKADAPQANQREQNVATQKPNQSVESNGEKDTTVKEVGGPKGLEPTRYGDWESKGRCYDF